MFKLTRKGIFLIEDFTENQCGSDSDVYYNYTITCFFHPEGLDKNGFLIDHNHINNAIQSADYYKSGSCEQLHLTIRHIIRDLFKGNYSFIGYVSKIERRSFKVSQDPDNQSFLEFIDLPQKYHYLV